MQELEPRSSAQKTLHHIHISGLLTCKQPTEKSLIKVCESLLGESSSPRILFPCIDRERTKFVSTSFFLQHFNSSFALGRNGRHEQFESLMKGGRNAVR